MSRYHDPILAYIDGDDATIIDDPHEWGASILDPGVTNLDDLDRRHDGFFDRERGDD